MKKVVFKENPPDLPENRLRQLLWVLRRHFYGVVLSSIYMFFFFLPSVGWIIFSSNAPLFAEGTLYDLLVIYGVLALLVPIGGLGAAGSTKYFRKLLFNEGASLKEDFYSGMKENGLSFCASLFVGSLAYGLLHLLSSLIANDTSMDGAIKALILGVAYAFFFLLVSILVLQGNLVTMYQGSWIGHLWVAAKLDLVSLYKSLPIYAVSYLPFFFYEFIPNLYLAFALLCLCAFFYFGFGCLLNGLYANHLFDRAFNKRLYPQIYRKGLLGQGDVSYTKDKK